VLELRQNEQFGWGRRNRPKMRRSVLASHFPKETLTMSTPSATQTSRSVERKSVIYHVTFCIPSAKPTPIEYRGSSRGRIYISHPAGYVLLTVLRQFLSTLFDSDQKGNELWMMQLTVDWNSHSPKYV
jgi:hypothetical protein